MYFLPTEMSQRTTHLKEQGWIDDQTRAVIVEFSMYNGNSRRFTVVQLIAEFDSGGGVLTSMFSARASLFRYNNPSEDIPTLLFEGASLLLT